MAEPRYDTLKDLLKFLILYSSLVFTEVPKEDLKGLKKEEKKEKIEENIKTQRLSMKMINLLPILAEIAE